MRTAVGPDLRLCFPTHRAMKLHLGDEDLSPCPEGAHSACPMDGAPSFITFKIVDRGV